MGVLVDWRATAAFVVGAYGFVHEVNHAGERPYVLGFCVFLMIPAAASLIQAIVLGKGNGKNGSNGNGRGRD